MSKRKNDQMKNYGTERLKNPDNFTSEFTVVLSVFLSFFTKNRFYPRCGAQSGSAENKRPNDVDEHCYQQDLVKSVREKYDSPVLPRNWSQLLLAVLSTRIFYYLTHTRHSRPNLDSPGKYNRKCVIFFRIKNFKYGIDCFVWLCMHQDGSGWNTVGGLLDVRTKF